jgi:hypothetical protein
MPCYNVANLMTVAKTNVIDEMPCGYETLQTTGVKYGTKSPAERVQRSQQLSNSPTDLRSGLSISKI